MLKCPEPYILLISRKKCMLHIMLYVIRPDLMYIHLEQHNRIKHIYCTNCAVYGWSLFISLKYSCYLHCPVLVLTLFVLILNKIRFLLCKYKGYDRIYIYTFLPPEVVILTIWPLDENFSTSNSAIGVVISILSYFSLVFYSRRESFPTPQYLLTTIDSNALKRYTLDNILMCIQLHINHLYTCAI